MPDSRRAHGGSITREKDRYNRREDESSPAQKAGEAPSRPQSRIESSNAPEGQQEVNTDFINEQIKARPINRKKLARRTLSTALLAVLFGAIACIVFLALEPLINKALNPEEPAAISIPEATTEEISPEEMVANDEAKQRQQTEEAVNEAVSQFSVDSDELKQEIKDELSSELSSGSGYEQMYASLSETAQKAQASLVSAAGISSDVDWAGDTFDSSRSTSGLVIAVTDDSVLMLVPGSVLESAESIEVTFTDGSKAEASVQARDPVTELCMLRTAVPDLSGTTLAAVTPAVFGSSQRISLLGRPVIAVGSPMGSQGSVAYGVVTNAQLALDEPDSNYQQITTDIYGSTRAAGILLDTNGEVIGWIDTAHQSEDTRNLISAIGITELKPLIENLSNRKPMGMAGLHGTDVPEEVQKDQGIPSGAYITRVEMDSAAMAAGVQSGDVVTALGGTEMSGWQQLVRALAETEPGRSYPLTVMRQASDGYDELHLHLTPAQRLTLAQ